jgi:hypothetical protein
MRATLYHTFLVIMLGSTVLAKSVEEEVRLNDLKVLIHRDNSEQYTPHQTREIMSEGIGTDGDVSMEGVTLLFKPVGYDHYHKILHTNLSNDKRQNALTVRCNIEHLLNDVDRGEISHEKLEGVIETTNGCAVQYRCRTVLHSFAQISSAYDVKYTRFVQAPGHGKEEIDGLERTEETHAN